MNKRVKKVEISEALVGDIVRFIELVIVGVERKRIKASPLIDINSRGKPTMEMTTIDAIGKKLIKRAAKELRARTADQTKGE